MSVRVFNHVVTDGGRMGAEVYYRAYLPGQFCAAELEADGIELVSGNQLDSAADLFGSYFVHRNLDAFWQCYLKAVQVAGRRIAWELDDNHWQIPTWIEGKGFLDDQERGINQIRDMADVVVASTDYLAGVARADAIVAPNLIDPQRFPKPREKSGNEPLRVLWAGSNTHRGDVEIVAPAVARLAKEFPAVEFVFWSYLPASLTGAAPNVLHLERVPLERYHDTLARIRPDVALAPLTDHPFNRARTNLKWLEMGAAGAAFVGSHLDPYHCVRHGEDGLVVPNEPEAWHDAVRGLILDGERRRHLATNARRRILREYSWMGPGRRAWLDAFRAAAGVPA